MFLMKRLTKTLRVMRTGEIYEGVSQVSSRTDICREIDKIHKVSIASRDDVIQQHALSAFARNVSDHYGSECLGGPIILYGLTYAGRKRYRTNCFDETVGAIEGTKLGRGCKGT